MYKPLKLPEKRTQKGPILNLMYFYRISTPLSATLTYEPPHKISNNQQIQISMHMRAVLSEPEYSMTVKILSEHHLEFLS